MLPKPFSRRINAFTAVVGAGVLACLVPACQGAAEDDQDTDEEGMGGDGGEQAAGGSSNGQGGVGGKAGAGGSPGGVAGQGAGGAPGGVGGQGVGGSGAGGSSLGGGSGGAPSPGAGGTGGTNGVQGGKGGSAAMGGSGSGGMPGGAGGMPGSGGTGGSMPPSGSVVRRGLIAQYDFRETSGDTVRDTSGVGAAFDLKMFRTQYIERLNHGVKFLKAPTSGQNDGPDQTTPIIRSGGAADKINNPIRAANAFSLEVWLKPTVLKQSGPARVISLDYTNYELTNLNLMHGPPGCSDGSEGQYVQLRIGGADNACPALPTPAQPNLTGQVQHLVLTQSGKDWVLYSNGQVSAKGTHTRSPSQWNTQAGLAFGNLMHLPTPGAAHANFRYWLGELYYVGWYDVALTEAEVKTNASIPYAQR
ncbi:MAG: LamG domain-containing protein [Myxococcales bacterium]|nr:LamG domain-containing protein [Myxococcales bacterium]